MTVLENPPGIRNNNPGNLRRSKDKWQGLAPKQTHRDFFQFGSPVYGIRALARTLINYQDRYGIRSVERIVKRWAPPVENKTQAYIDDVAKRTGFEPDAKLDMHTYVHLRPLTEAIIWHENGQQPYTDAQIDKALTLAGVEKAEKSLKGSRTMAGGRIAAAGTAGASGLEIVQQTDVLDLVTSAQGAVEPLTDYLEIAKWVMLGLVLVGIGITMYARWDDFRKLAR